MFSVKHSNANKLEEELMKVSTLIRLVMGSID